MSRRSQAQRPFVGDYTCSKCKTHYVYLPAAGFSDSPSHTIDGFCTYCRPRLKPPKQPKISKRDKWTG